MNKTEEAIQNNEGTIVDVRTREEFMGGHVINSINIPVQELAQNMEKLMQLPTPLILCCASGGRSGMAAEVLQKAGIDCFNAGSWLEVNHYVNQD